MDGVVLVPLLLAGFSEEPEGAIEDVDVEVWDAHVGIVVLRDELHRLQGAGAGDPDLRVRLLNWAGPGVEEA